MKTELKAVGSHIRIHVSFYLLLITAVVNDAVALFVKDIGFKKFGGISKVIFTNANKPHPV